MILYIVMDFHAPNFSWGMESHLSNLVIIIEFLFADISIKKLVMDKRQHK